MLTFLHDKIILKIIVKRLSSSMRQCFGNLNFVFLVIQSPIHLVLQYNPQYWATHLSIYVTPWGKSQLGECSRQTAWKKTGQWLICQMKVCGRSILPTETFYFQFHKQLSTNPVQQCNSVEPPYKDPLKQNPPCKDLIFSNLFLFDLDTKFTSV